MTPRERERRERQPKPEPIILILRGYPHGNVEIVLSCEHQVAIRPGFQESSGSTVPFDALVSLFFCYRQQPLVASSDAVALDLFKVARLVLKSTGDSRSCPLFGGPLSPPLSQCLT